MNLMNNYPSCINVWKPKYTNLHFLWSPPSKW